MRGIVKKFPGVIANDEVDLTVEKGEIHGLLGENGAGKSTLMKILYGLYNKDAGEIHLDGDQIEIGSPQQAIDAGIGMVHQHFMLIPKLSVTQNVILGKREASNTFTSDKTGSSGLLGTLGEMFSIDHKGPQEKIADLSSDYGFGINPADPVWQLEVGEQQRVEILKALYRDVDLLILDEPTAVLTPNEADQLFETLEELADDGLSIIFITHKLYEIKQITDRVTILRDGKHIETVETAAMSETDLAERMVGHEVLFDLEKSELDRGEVAMEASNLQAKNDRGLPAVKGVDVQIRSGEIVGIAAVSGNGQKELAECLVGVRDIEGGTLSVDGSDLTDAHPIEFINEGVSFIPEDRLKYGLAPELPIMHNTGVKEYRKDRFQSGPFLDYGEMEAYTNEIIEEFDIRGINDPREMEAGDLSGGNMQKLIVGRESYRNPDVLIANQPTRGVDVGAIESIRRNLLDQRDKGMGILLVSENLDEVLDMSDRILVVYEGEIVYETTPEEADKGEIGLKMTGGGTTEASVATDGGQDNTASSGQNGDIGDCGAAGGDQ
ncbi:ABC transporter ATP-binding protein [Halodesulfurarchaeum sp.]|uniref:ABC transporter ATP-binding protein n=1 Tax=Halodesulfurarchaeum sp. TaxID=1980530 RepID=UPI002FC27524